VRKRAPKGSEKRAMVAWRRLRRATALRGSASAVIRDTGIAAGAAAAGGIVEPLDELISVPAVTAVTAGSGAGASSGAGAALPLSERGVRGDGGASVVAMGDAATTGVGKGEGELGGSGSSFSADAITA